MSWLPVIVASAIAGITLAMTLTMACIDRREARRQVNRVRPNYSLIQRLERELFGDVFTRNPKHPGKTPREIRHRRRQLGEVIYLDGKLPEYIDDVRLVIESNWDREARERRERRG